MLIVRRRGVFIADKGGERSLLQIREERGLYCGQGWRRSCRCRCPDYRWKLKIFRKLWCVRKDKWLEAV